MDAASASSQEVGRSAQPLSRQLAWFAGGAAASFLVPFVFSGLLELQHDVYLGIYFAFVAGLLTAYLRRAPDNVADVVRRNWRWGLAAGIVVGIPVVRNVFTETGTAHPDGIYFAFELLWRGAVYGAVDAVLLTVFPCLLVYHALGGPLRTWGRRVVYFVGSLILVLTITAVYHLGFEQYREDGIGEPEIGNSLMSLPMLLTSNPIGSVLDHGAMHLAAVIHEYEGDTRLPPETEVED